jgi:uncharacterized OB-fold protein
MTYEEALLILLETIMPVDKENEALEKAIEALEKQIPKKPLLVPDGKSKIHTFKCPTCGQAMYRVRLFCDDCGQAIDWSNEK